MVRFRLPLIVAAALSTALSATAYAQSTVEAEKLFRDGKALMKKGNIAEACDAFDGSQRIEPNVATLMSLADCREKNQQYASAWGWFLKAESMTRNEPGKGALNATARKRAAAIEPRMSYLTVNVPDESRIEGLVVSRNGVMIDPGTWNRAVPVDGGDYEIEGKAPGHEQWSTKITVKPENDKQAVEVPKFKELPKLIEQKPVGGVGGGIVTTIPDRPFQFTTKRKIAVRLAGGSVVALATGIVLGVKSSSLQSQADKKCTATACDPTQAAAANHLNDRAGKWAWGADAAFGVSLGAAIGAGVLFYLGGSSDELVMPEDGAEEQALRIRPHVGDFTGFTLDRSF